jgi:hypothetical protein
MKNTKYFNAVNEAIDNDIIDIEYLKSKFIDYLYNKDYDFDLILSYTDEHFENLLTFKQNFENFKKFIKL